MTMNDPAPDHRIRLAAIRKAATTIAPEFLNTAQYQCEPLNDALGCSVTLKIETANPIRSFKGRGGWNLVAERYRAGAFTGKPVIAASAGNWGQALAYACRAHGIPLTMFASTAANPLKIAMMERLGAKILLEGHDFDDSKRAAKIHADQVGGVTLVDGRDVEASEGAGTIGLELMQLQNLPEVILVPLGNGAMLTGIARWVKSVHPEIRIVGVQSAGADAMERSWREKRVIEADAVSTIADGIGVRVPIPEALQDMEGLVDDVLTVQDSAILEAMRLIYQKAGLLVEPSAGASLAPLLSHAAQFQGKHCAVIMCGGNLTDAQVRQWIMV
jgi:threonine dehydratase